MASADGPDAGSRRAYFHLQLASSRLRVLADRECRRRAGVTGPQAGALYVIAAHPGSTQRTLATVLRHRESAINGMVTRLCAQGLVIRRRSARDARAWELELTVAGRDTVAALDEATAALNEAITDAVGDGSIDSFVTALEALEAVPLPDDAS